jgi:hypothetical protein
VFIVGLLGVTIHTWAAVRRLVLSRDSPEAPTLASARTCRVTRRRERLVRNGVPGVGEKVMVRASRGEEGSPAQAAKRKAPKRRKG